MRRAFDPQPRLDCPPITAVLLNTKCRDEIIPILRALQHLYGDDQQRHTILTLVGKDVNRTTSRKRGRRGLDYWPITVLAAVRLGCNLDYDKLQDLAEQHRHLRHIMGIGDWQNTEEDFDWRRLRDNIALLRPETVEKLNQCIVSSGHQLAPQAVKTVRCDTFVVETNIHHPTESSLIRDGLRKVVTLAAALAKDYGVNGWRQHEHLLTKVRALVREIGRAARSKSKNAPERRQRGYRELLGLAKELLERAGELLTTIALRGKAPGTDLVLTAQGQEVQHYRELTQKVCDTARRRVLRGETVPNADKLFSIFEPETELINRGKQPNPIQYGPNVLVVEDGVGLICHDEVVGKGVLDQELAVPVLKKLQQRLGGKIERASFDRAFHTPQNQEELAQIVSHPCLPMKGAVAGRDQQEQATVAFRQARQSHPGVESAIGALQTGNGLERCRDRSDSGYRRYVGLGILGRNLPVLGKLLLSQEDADCLAAKSKRKKTG